jgi:serine/threonine-protein kinase
MGTVYLAVSRGAGDFRKLKVVKHLRSDLACQPTFLQAFLDEARLAARLNHPNVVQTNEVGFDGEHYFLEMEYLEGQSLEMLLRGAPPPQPVGLFVLCEVLAGLHYAHELTDTDGTPLWVVHRDVTPHNVFVTYDGTVKLLDFGIAKAAGASQETSTRVIKGKAAYMSPEQAGRRPVDRRADVFSAGVILWRLLVGKKLWEDASDEQIFHRLAEGDIPAPRSVSGETPAALEALCMKALSVDPARRFATARDFQRALEEHTTAGARALSEWMLARFGEEREATVRRIDAQLRDASSAPPPPLSKRWPNEREASVTRTTSSETPPGGAASGAGGRGGQAGGAITLSSSSLRSLGALSVGAALLVLVARRPTSHPPPPSEPQGCVTNAECIQQNGDAKPFCRKDRRQCVTLESPRCTVRAEKGDLENDATVWIGTMFPMTGPDAEAFGLESVNAADLARRDFMTIAHGIPSQTSGRPPRPIALLACDDAGDAAETARHLTEDVRVPAVVGFYSSQEVIDLASGFFISRDVVAMATQNKSTLITTLPHPPGSPRLVWRTTISASQAAAPVSAVVEESLEPTIRPLLRRGEAVRVALFRSDNAMGLSVSDAYLSKLRVNGKTALENGAAYREFVVADDVDAEKDAALVREVLRFRPHVILLPGVDSGATARLLEPIESGWSDGESVRPRYVVSGYIFGDDFFAFLGKSAQRRRRFLGVNPPATTRPNAKLTMHYNETFSPKVALTASPGAVYDAVYVLAYALYALGDEPVTGTAIARAIGRLVPPAVPVDVGPANIFDAFNGLRGGGHIDLEGAATRLDFDLATGDSPTDFAVLCIGVDDQGRASHAVESSVTYRTAAGRLDHLPLNCP